MKHVNKLKTTAKLFFGKNALCLQIEAICFSIL